METYPDYSVLLDSHILFLLHIAPQRKKALAIVGLKAREGCLSIPGLRGNVARAGFAAVSYVDLGALAVSTHENGSKRK